MLISRFRAKDKKQNEFKQSLINIFTADTFSLMQLNATNNFPLRFKHFQGLDSRLKQATGLISISISSEHKMKLKLSDELITLLYSYDEIIM